MNYNPHEIEAKWRARWEESDVFDTSPSEMEDPFYVLTMFPYPSGERLHMGHWYQYGIMDTWARFQKLKGREVFQPMGFDSFGLPAENYAIKSGVHPAESTAKNVAYMTDQYRRMGVGYAWKHTIDSSDPGYYRWTQWLFLQLYRRGLAYRAGGPVNWCPDCKTVLANEQVKDGLCERCDTRVTVRELEQWYFRITEYAEELGAELENLDWPSKTKAMQRNWIGRSSGTDIVFRVAGSVAGAVHDADSMENENAESGCETRVFTTRADTLFGVTYIVLAPEHPLVEEITTSDRLEAVREYITRSAARSELDRISDSKEKTGVFTGGSAVHPLTGELLPIWIADYVLAGYGTGAVMAVPAHDERDFEFARRFGLPIRPVITPEAAHPGTRTHFLAPGFDPDSDSGTNTGIGTSVRGADEASDNPDALFTGYGIVFDSGDYTGMTSREMIARVSADLAAAGKGGPLVRYRLRDWLISRQRYWGAPIPIVHCPECGVVPVPEEDLPVRLPEAIEFRPTGVSPLGESEEFMSAPCPVCGRPGRRESDTLDTFVCSSWYYLRFPDPDRDDVPFDPDLTRKTLPVDRYCGGPEHACMHLLYARFVCKVLRDAGYIEFGEPFPHLTHQGLVLGPDRRKMSKRGNAVSPDPYVEEYGADVLRLCLLFSFDFTEGGPWDEGGFAAACRFLDRIWLLLEENRDLLKGTKTGADHKAENPNLETIPYTVETDMDRDLAYRIEYTVLHAGRDTDAFKFNTAVARLMELVSDTGTYLRTVPPHERNDTLLSYTLRAMVIMLAPFVPHFAEEWWERAGGTASVFSAAWPVVNEQYLVRRKQTFAVMVNGKKRGEVTVPEDAGEEKVVESARGHQNVTRYLEGAVVSQTIFVPGRLVNFIIC